MDPLKRVQSELCPDDIDRQSSSWWQERQKSILDAVKNQRDSTSFIRRIQRNSVSGFDHRVTFDECDDLKNICLYKYKLLIKQHSNLDEILDKSEEAKESEPNSIVTINGHRVSNIYLSHIKNFLEATDGNKKKINRVLEIGGGYGSLARIFLNIIRPQYFMVDMKISLACAYVFLSETVPSIKVFLQREENEEIDIEKTAQEYDVILLLPTESNFTLLSDLQIDLCINVGSLQEMTPGRSEFFQRNIFSNLNIKRFYSLNYFLNPNDLNKIDHERNIGDKPIVPTLEEGWAVKKALINDPVWCIDASERNWMEIIIEKGSIEENKQDATIDSISAILNQKRLSLPEYITAYKFIFNFFEFLVNPLQNCTGESINMLYGVVKLGGACNGGADIINKIEQSFKVRKWLGKQIPEVKYMRKRLFKPGSLFIFFIEWLEILKALIRQRNVITDKPEIMRLEKSGFPIRKTRKGLPTIDWNSFNYYQAVISDASLQKQ
jgi:putative sugar O-methyltransferase